MASSFFSFCRLRINGPDFSKVKVHLLRSPQACRSQSFGDNEEGKSWDRSVDAGMNVLKYRIEQVRIKERLNTSDEKQETGWNYGSHQYDVVHKKNNLFLMSIELASIVCRTLGLVFLSGSLCIFLVSLIFGRSWTSSN